MIVSAAIQRPETAVDHGNVCRHKIGEMLVDRIPKAPECRLLPLRATGGDSLAKTVRAIAVVDGLQNLIDIGVEGAKLMYCGGASMKTSSGISFKSFAHHSEIEGEHWVVETGIDDDKSGTAEVWAVALTPELIVLAKCYRDDIPSLETAGHVYIKKLKFRL